MKSKIFLPALALLGLVLIVITARLILSKTKPEYVSLEGTKYSVSDFLTQFPPSEGLNFNSQDNIVNFPFQILESTSLKVLTIKQNPLAVIPSEINNLRQLENLEISHTKISSLPPTISDLTNLKKLSLQSNRLRSLPEEIGLLTNLELLDLRENNLKSLPASLVNLVNLKGLFLGGNPLPPDQVNQLRQALPTTTINF